MTPEAIKASGTYLGGIINEAGKLVGIMLPLVAGLALLYFLWGLAKFIFHGGDEKNVEEGKNRMKWGVVALFVMIGVWGLVSLIRQFLGLEAYSPPDPGLREPVKQNVCTTDSHGITICTLI